MISSSALNLAQLCGAQWLCNHLPPVVDPLVSPVVDPLVFSGVFTLLLWSVHWSPVVAPLVPSGRSTAPTATQWWIHWWNAPLSLLQPNPEARAPASSFHFPALSHALPRAAHTAQVFCSRSLLCSPPPAKRQLQEDKIQAMLWLHRNCILRLVHS
jgi:hypothetical protein